jgi:hypothetical protein
MSDGADIAVVGSGAAGIAAAVCAARAGCRVLLLDRNEGPGGTGGFSGLTTLCGLYDDDGQHLNDGFPGEFAGRVAEGPPLQMGRVWVLPYRPEKFRAVANELLAETPGIEARWNTPVALERGHSVREFQARPAAADESSATRGQNVRAPLMRVASLNGIPVRAVIDCSGSAEAARVAGAECLETDATTQAPATVFPLRNVVRAPETPAEMARVLLPLARAGLPPVSFQPCLDAHAVTVKFAGRPEQVAEVIACLRANVSGFERCETDPQQIHVAHRAGRMILGRQVLTGADVLAARKFPDAVARCAWPIEQWNAAGVARLRYLPAGAHYEIPAGSLRAAGVENLFMAGKTISADVNAIASARVMGCCLATGAAAGLLAARYLQSAPTR